MNLGKGLNLGGWLSQTPEGEEHRKTFITRDDFKRIADWGFDNVRIPFDYPLLCPTPNDRIPCEAGFVWIDRGLEWAEQCGLKAVLDMHQLPGFSFYDPTARPGEIPPFFTSESKQSHFYELWAAVSKRYLGRFPDTVFELANEIVAPTAQQWNRLAAKAVAAIRGVDRERYIVVGSNMWNTCWTYPELAVMPDTKIIYNFHFYDPFTFTHQKASWSPQMVYYNQTVHYPGSAPGLREAAERAGREGKTAIADALRGLADALGDRVSDKQHLRELMQWPFDFAAQHKVPLYCGEFGVHDPAPREDSVRWMKDTVDIFAENNIAWSYWSYKEMGFGIVDRDGKVQKPETLEVMRGIKN